MMQNVPMPLAKLRRYDIANRRNKMDKLDEFRNHIGRTSVLTLVQFGRFHSYFIIGRIFCHFPARTFPRNMQHHARVLAWPQVGRSKKGNLVLD